jgi:hypothetical protein
MFTINPHPTLKYAMLRPALTYAAVNVMELRPPAHEAPQTSHRCHDIIWCLSFPPGVQKWNREVGQVLDWVLRYAA